MILILVYAFVLSYNSRSMFLFILKAFSTRAVIPEDGKP